MMMIEKVSGIEFLKDHEITDLKPQFPIAPIITKDVPSTSTPQPPPSTRSSIATPASSSFSSGGVLRVLKGMLAWCHDTRQCQDVLLSNQRRQNEKLGIDEFDEFSLSVPLLDDDPFASLAAADLAAMEGAPPPHDDNEEASDSE
jgi:hypothetical protein